MKITLGQICSTEDKSANLEVIRAQTAVAAAAGSSLIVFPEFAMYDLPMPDYRFVENAEPIGGRFTSAIALLASEFGITIVAGMLETVDGEDRAYNTLVAYDSRGMLVARYRKVHLYNAFGARESDLIRPSDDEGAVVFDVDGTRVGLHTCYDLRFPEITRELVDANADVVVLPASWVPGPRKEDHWKILSQARAIENTVYFAAVSQAPPVSTGGSLFIDPMGIIVGELGEVVSTGTFEIDLARLAAVRAKNPSLTDRRYSVSRRQLQGA